MKYRVSIATVNFVLLIAGSCFLWNVFGFRIAIGVFLIAWAICPVPNK